ncbi:MAG: hypothetical protein R3Y23_03730 [Bacillota bacterium]
MPKLEIERKFLIVHPSKTDLIGLKKCEMVQTYLIGEQGEARRVRKCIKEGITSYIYTAKRHITAITRTEEEYSITEVEYNNLLKDKDNTRQTIHKTRYYINKDNLIFELDCFKDKTKVAYLEVELASETQHFTLPAFISVVKEVTHDMAYTNKAIAKQFPKEF